MFKRTRYKTNSETLAFRKVENRSARSMEDAKEKKWLSLLRRQLPLHWPWGVWGREKEKNVSPVSPHSPTRSLKQDNEACEEGSNQLKLYSRMAFPWDWVQTRATWTVLPSIFVRFLISFFPTSTMRTSAFCPLNKHFSWQGFEFSLISVPYLIRRKGNRFLKWL